MKKTITLVLALVLVLSLSVGAFAAGSSGTGSTGSSDNTSGKTVVGTTVSEAAEDALYYTPNIDRSDENKSSNLKLTEWDERANKLTPEQQEQIETAESQLGSQTPDDTNGTYLSYAEAYSWPQTLLMTAALPEGSIAKMYTTKREWIPVKLSKGNTTLTLTETGSLAIFVPVGEMVATTVEDIVVTPEPTKGVSPSGSGESGETTSELPTYKLSGANIKYNLEITGYSERKIKLTTTRSDLFEAARRDLKNVTPEGMTCQYLVYQKADAWPQDFQTTIMLVSDVKAKIYTQDGVWVDLPVENGEDLQSMHLEEEGVLAIFTVPES